MCFIPEYITIVMNHDTHYDYLYANGLRINGIKYFRLSTSAGQGRESTVTFCSSEILEAVNEILDNGRDVSKKMSPSKFNAYKGTYGSATKVVTTPRFCVVPDYKSEVTFKVNHVTETGNNQDDDIEEKIITRSFDRFDGQGLISPKMAKIWADDLGLDYIPAEFCFRQSYMKGMLAVFDIHKFCEEENSGNYIIKTSYKDKNGKNIEVDLKDIDVIISESQFKLWDSYNNIDTYIDNCKKNNLYWGVALCTDKEIENSLMYNYQFLQVLDIDKNDIPKLCEDFENWIRGVNTDDIWQTLLFLMGTHTTKDSIEKYFKNSKNYWVKSLIVNHNLINDRYVKQKIYSLIRKKIENGCIGRIVVEGNNQTLVSDPFAMMEFVCGKEPKGLLGEKEYYSHYWNSKNVNQIVGTRPPLTYRSEVTKLSLVNNDKMQKWYKYLYGGIIVNIHGHETDNWAGSDFDFDFLSTTNNQVILNSVYENEYPIVYEAPKPKKINFTDEDLYKSDKFTFGSIIGAITNKSTTGITLLDDLKIKYGENSREYRTVLNRIKMCTKLQSAQIDKAKIGKEVKGIPKIWTDRKYIDSLNISKDEKDFLKRIMMDRHPYFFRFLYPNTKRKYKQYIEEYELSCRHKFGIGLDELLKKQNLTEDELKYRNMFYKYMPVIDSDSVMNNICKYIENINFDIKSNINNKDNKDVHLILMRNNEILNPDLYQKVLQKYKSIKKEIKQYCSANTKMFKNKYDENAQQSVNNIYSKFKETMNDECSNIYELVDYLIYIFYVEYVGDNKDLLWNTYGDIIFENVKNKNQNTVLFPMPNKEGNIKYLHQNFKLEEVEL